VAPSLNTVPPMGSPLVHRIRVRYHECDRQGVVFNAHYLAYFDLTLTELWRAAFGGYDVMVDRGVDLVVAEAQLGFRRSARFDDEIDIELSISHMGNSSLVTQYAIRRDGDLLLEGQTRHVFVDAKTLAKTSIPDWVRAGLEPWLVAWHSS
jgi:acyl-CoA thioester hydrolase